MHHGHLRLALECLEAADLAEVAMVPLHTPPHRESPAAAPEQRREMLRLALEGVPGLRLEDCELRRGGVSYTVDTLAELRDRYADHTLCLILGSDAFGSINTWHRWTLLLQRAHIIVVQRPGTETNIQDPEVAAVYTNASVKTPQGLRSASAGKILDVHIPLLDISATRLREMIATGRNARFLLPPSVLAYIEAQHLYS